MDAFSHAPGPEMRECAPLARTHETPDGIRPHAQTRDAIFLPGGAVFYFLVATGTCFVRMLHSADILTEQRVMQF